jgi:uncharacterized protein (DUF2141 family)
MHLSFIRSIEISFNRSVDSIRARRAAPAALWLAASALAPVVVVATAPALAQPATGAELTVKVQGVKTTDGDIKCALFASADGFADEPKKAAQRTRAAITSGAATCTFAKVPAGAWAVAVLHDANSNEKLDKNFFGVPTEGYSVSNDATKALAPPSYDDAKFTTDGTAKTLTVNLRY